MGYGNSTLFWVKNFSHLLIPVRYLTPLSSPKNHLWQVLPCDLSKDSWGMPKKHSESRTSSWSVSCFPTLTCTSYPYTHPAPSLLFTLPLSHKYSTASFSYWKENHNFKPGFEPHTQPQKLLKLCGITLLFAAPGWEEAIIWTACSVEGRHKITCCCAEDLKYPWCKQAAYSHRASCQDTASRRVLLPCFCITVPDFAANVAARWWEFRVTATLGHIFILQHPIMPLSLNLKDYHLLQLRRKRDNSGKGPSRAQNSAGLKQSIGNWDFHRIIKVGRDHWISSTPTPLPKQGHLKSVTQEHNQEGFECLVAGTRFC